MEKIPTLHHPEGIEPDRMFFHEETVRNLILEYQREPTPQTWQGIVVACLPLIESLIRGHNFQLYEDKDVLKNECIIKLFKTIRHFNPDRGRAFSVLSVAFTRFLFSYVQNVRLRSKRLSLVQDEILEGYESAGQVRAHLPEELKTKIQGIRTRFKTKPERAAARFLINYFLLEGFSQPRKLVLDTVKRQFDLSLERAGALYDYTLVSLRSVLHEYYTPLYSAQEMLRLCYRSSVLPEIHALIGEKSFAKLMDVFAGLTVTFPSKAGLEKLRKSREFLNSLSDEKRAFSPSALGPGTEHQLLNGMLEGHHIEAPLYAEGEG
jgi:hypothetical protein